jgi:hypothetical protein
MNQPAERLRPLGARVTGALGTLVSVELPERDFPGYQALLDHLAEILDADVEVRMVLGRACTTAARAIDQFVAALQFPYEAARGWNDFLAEFGERPVSPPLCVVVADAADLLKHEDPDLWSDLVSRVYHPRSCMSHPNTLVLADFPYRWERSMFGSAAAAEKAGNRFPR